MRAAVLAVFAFGVALAAPAARGAASVPDGQDEEVLVCQSCGAEAPSLSARFCSSCGAALEGAAAAAPATPGPPPEPASPLPASGEAFSAAGAVAFVSAADSDLVAARAQKARGDKAYEIAALGDALLAARLFPAADPALAPSLAARRAKALDSATAPVRERCPVCNGARTVAEARAPAPPTASGAPGSSPRRIEESAVAATSPPRRVRCGFCGGAGALPKAMPREKALDDIRIGAAAFARDAEAAGRVELHGVWWAAPDAAAIRTGAVAREIRDSLRLVRRDCEKCAGTGTVECRECGGWGRVRCPDPVHGVSASRPVPGAAGGRPGASGTVGRIEDHVPASPSAAACRTCGSPAAARGAVRCKACSGRAVVACRACKGTGHVR